MNTETQTTRDVPNAEKGRTFEETLVEYFAWVESEFPDETVEDQIGHLFEEFGELITGRHNVAEEFADVLMLLCCVAHGKGFDIVCEFRKKLAVNKARAWEKTSCGYRHATVLAPTDTSRKPESGASGCGGAEEAKTDEAIAREAARLFYARVPEATFKTYKDFLSQQNLLNDIILAALRQKSASKEPIEK